MGLWTRTPKSNPSTSANPIATTPSKKKSKFKIDKTKKYETADGRFRKNAGTKMEHHLLNKMTSWIPWNRAEKRPSQEDVRFTPILSLIHPYVTEPLLECLDYRSLLALRLVCRATKSWVDSSKHMNNLRVNLHSYLGAKRIRKVLKSKTDFCNFRFCPETRTNLDVITNFCEKVGHRIKFLDLSVMISHSVLIRVIRNCPNLESLSLLGLNVSREDTWYEDLKGVASKLSVFKALSIGSILFCEEEELNYIKYILEICDQLLSLRLPHVNLKPKDSKTHDQTLSKYLLYPLMTSIQNRGLTSKTNLKHLILELVNPLPMTPELFLQLANICYEYKVILHNVHQSYLKCLGPENQQIQEIMGTLDGLNEHIHFRRLTNIQSLQLWVTSSIPLKDENYAHPVLPKLESVNLYLDTEQVDQGVHRLLQNVLRVERPGVTSLKISFSTQGGNFYANIVKGIDITVNFQHLTKLHMYQWDAFDEEFLLLWNGLGSHRIQEVTLLLCTNLSDRGLLGDDPRRPAIMKLTSLQDLHLSSLYGSITDAFIRKAVRHMPLLKFRLYSQSVSYDGIASLLDGVFISSVTYLHSSKPFDCTQKEYYYLVKDILNAKVCPDFHKKRHLRRRSQPMILSEPSDEE